MRLATFMEREYDSTHRPRPPNHSGFVVLGAGLSRTGTMSLRLALEQLLDGPCYHMMNVTTGEKEETVFWRRVLEGKVRKGEEWVHFLQGRGFRAGVDAPVALFYREIMEAFPAAKVVLTVREPGSWYRSVRSSILRSKYVLQDFACVQIVKILGAYDNLSMTVESGNFTPPGFEKGILDSVDAGESEAVDFYNKWVGEVKQNVPKDRLLVFEVKQGWKPLCEFLGLPIPDTPFPHLNDANAMSALFTRLEIGSYTFVYVIPVFISLLTFILMV